MHNLSRKYNRKGCTIKGTTKGGSDNIRTITKEGRDRTKETTKGGTKESTKERDSRDRTGEEVKEGTGAEIGALTVGGLGIGLGIVGHTADNITTTKI